MLLNFPECNFKIILKHTDPEYNLCNGLLLIENLRMANTLNLMAPLHYWESEIGTKCLRMNSSTIDQQGAVEGRKGGEREA